MKRRAFIGNTTLVLAGLQLGLLTGCRDHTLEALQASPTEPGALQALEVIAASLQGAGFAGPYCAQRFESPDSRLLEHLRATGAGDLASAIDDSIVADFAGGRIEDIAGWQVSLTECLLLAVAARRQPMQDSNFTQDKALKAVEFVDVIDWGPRETYQGQIFNPQPGERGGLWFMTGRQAPSSTHLLIGGQTLLTDVRPDLITVALPAGLTAELIGTPGVHELTLVDVARGHAQPVGTLTVHPPAPPAMLADGSRSRVFCEIEGWGPQMTTAGSAFNLRPDGSSSFWVRIPCAPPDVYLTMGDERLPTSSQPGLVAGRVVNHQDMERGIHELWLVDPVSGERLQVGVFEVL